MEWRHHRLFVTAREHLSRGVPGGEQGQARDDARRAKSRLRSQRSASRAGRPVRARDHLSARLGDRSLRFSLRLLHVGAHDVPAQGRPALARRARPAVRRGIMTLVASLARHLSTGALDELTLTTNGSQLAKYAGELVGHGVRRINVSLDTLDPDKFRAITRWGELDKVLAGIDAAQAAGLKVKINAVALKGVNEDEFPALLEWAHGRGMELTLIEVMPLGEIGSDRLDQYLPLSIVRARLGERFTLEDIDYRSGGPARYVNVAETGGRLGFITPLTHNFCESCNRVRVTCTGTLYMCLGQEDAADLRTPLRASEGNALLDAAIAEAISRKPKGHDFIIDRRHQRPALSRHMSVTGG